VVRKYRVGRKWRGLEGAKVMERGRTWHCFVNLNNRDTQPACWQVYLQRMESFMAVKKIISMEGPPFICPPGTLIEIIFRFLWIASTSWPFLTKVQFKSKDREEAVTCSTCGANLQRPFNAWRLYFSSAFSLFRGRLCVLFQYQHSFAGHSLADHNIVDK